MTLRKLIEKLDRYPEYMKDCEIIVETIDNDDQSNFEIVDVNDSMYNRIFIQIKENN